MISALLILPYFLLIVVLHRGLNKPCHISPAAAPEPVSVLVPFRNESANLGRLVRFLENQNWQKGDEIVFIDDHSDDDSLSVLKTALSRVSFHTAIISSAGRGKKAALRCGIQAAEKDLVITIDADVKPGNKWLDTIRNPFRDPKVQMVCGAVHVSGAKRFRQRMETLDLLSLVASGRALTAQGMAVMCNGANLAYRKTAFASVGGYGGNDDAPSGDDTFLLHKIMAAFPGSIFIPLPRDGGAVEVDPQPSLKSLFHQRIRWAGKTVQYKSRAAITTSLIVGFTCLLICLLLAFGWILGREFFMVAWQLWLGKALLDLIFLYRAARLYRHRIAFFPALIQSLIYPFYTSLIAVMAPFSAFNWKGRYASARAFKR